jgi:hypothetical protein
LNVIRKHLDDIESEAIEIGNAIDEFGIDAGLVYKDIRRDECIIKPGLR